MKRPRLSDKRIKPGIPEVPRFSVIPCDDGNLSYVSAWKNVDPYTDKNIIRQLPLRIFDGYNSPAIRFGHDSEYKSVPNVVIDPDGRATFDRKFGEIRLFNRAVQVGLVAQIFDELPEFKCLTEIVRHDRLNPVSNDKEIEFNCDTMKEFIRDEDSEDGLITREFDPPTYKGPPTKWELERDQEVLSKVIEV